MSEPATGRRATVAAFPFDLAELLDTPEARAEYLALAVEEGGLAEVRRAVSLIICAVMMAAGLCINTEHSSGDRQTASGLLQPPD